MLIKQHIDAPLVPLLFCAGGIVILVLGLVPPISIQNSIGNWIGGVWLIVCGTIFLRTSLKGKANIWDSLLQNESINPSGRYLDIGCGNGLVMFKLAEHLKSGHVTGIDIWSVRDQTFNSQQSVTDSIKKKFT
ncbi:methyltransferase domain-containing protein [Secundilactobacillus kimchicus]|uniref:methyltransferase domain-containing protein n=1 Tax=Secundilactobacillus kimchicus TaxID=528209 RepID=UPI000AA2100F